VDILLLRWFMRCKLIVVFGVLIDIYVISFLYDYSDLTSMLRCVWGMCALGRAILWYA
jgi:hypothetical protein